MMVVQWVLYPDMGKIAGGGGITEVLKQALAWYANGLDFADALHLALSHDAKQLVTFDKKFVKLAKKSGASLTVI